MNTLTLEGLREAIAKCAPEKELVVYIARGGKLVDFRETEEFNELFKEHIRKEMREIRIVENKAKRPKISEREWKIFERWSREYRRKKLLESRDET